MPHLHAGADVFCFVLERIFKFNAAFRDFRNGPFYPNVLSQTPRPSIRRFRMNQGHAPLALLEQWADRKTSGTHQFLKCFVGHLVHTRKIDHLRRIYLSKPDGRFVHECHDAQ